MAKGGEFSCPEVGTVSWPFVGIVAWPLTQDEEWSTGHRYFDMTAYWEYKATQGRADVGDTAKEGQRVA